MSLHILVFIGLFLLFAGLTLRRSSWGIPLYMLTYYMSPNAASWGDPLDFIGMRWTLVASLIFAVGVLIDQRKELRNSLFSSRSLLFLMLAYAINASIVHVLFADNPENSLIGLTELWKKVGLLLLLVKSIKNHFDLKLMIFCMVIGAGYVGYEVVVNDSLSGSHDGRLWINIGGHTKGNHATALMAMSLPLGAYMLLWGNKVEKIVTVGSLALILETVLRCNSRGVTLGLIGGAVWLAVRARGRMRKYAIGGIILGIGGALYTMDVGDEDSFFTRFSSTFAAEEDRDDSVLTRTFLWGRSLEMLQDHPLGSGFEAAFESDLGVTYLQGYTFGKYRSCHQGYIDIAASWGVQGLLLYLAAIGLAGRYLLVTTFRTHALENSEASFLGCCLEAAFMVQLITSLFGSNLKSDSCVWLMAMALAYSLVFLTSNARDGKYHKQVTFSEKIFELNASPSY